MDTLLHFWGVFWDYFREGLTHINPILGLAIAIVGGLMVSGIVSLFFISVLAVVVHILGDALIPVVLNHAPFVLPPLEKPLVHYAVTLYVAYFVAIGAIFLLKTIFASARE